ncbi:MAG: ComEC/Rec2 family competence protein [Planctomycetota bacterium]
MASVPRPAFAAARDETPGEGRPIRYPFLPIALSFAGGLALATWLPVPLAVAMALWPVAGAGAIVLARRGRVVLAAALVGLSFFIAGSAWGRLSARVPPDDLSRAEFVSGRPAPVELRVVVREVPLAPHPADPDPRTAPLVVDIVAVRAGGAGQEWRACSGRATLRVGRDGAPPPGIWPSDELRLVGSVRLPRESRTPGGFDRRAALLREGIRLELDAPAEGIEVTGRGSWLSARRASARLRAYLASGLRRALSPRESEILSALLLGYRPGIDPADRARFAESGLGHLLAVSGLHLAILAGLMGWVLRRMGVGRRPMAVALGAFAVFYAMLAGARPPVVRAATMVVTYLAASVLGRDRDLANTVAFAAFALLVWRPAWLEDAGFQLSFAAVAFIAFLFPVLEDAWRAWRGEPEEFMEPLPENRFERALHRVRQAVFVSLAASLGVQPLLVHHLGFLNPWAVASNVLVLPLATGALAGGVLLLAAGAVWSGLGMVFAWPARAGLWTLLAAVEAFARLPWSVVHLPSPGAGWLVAYYGLALALFLRAPSGVKALRERLSPEAGAPTVLRRFALAAGGGAAALAVSAAALSYFARDEPASPSVTVLDLGNSRAALVRTASGDDVLVNAGSPGAETALLRRMRELGVSAVACVLLTRDEEACVSGAAALVEEFPPGVLAFPAGAGERRGRGPGSEVLLRAKLAARARGSLVVWPRAPDELSTGAGTGEAIRWLGPAGPARWGEAGSAVALLIRAGGGLDILVFDPGERPFPAGPPTADAFPNADVLVVFPPTRSGPSPGLTAKRVADAVGAVARSASPGVTVVPLSRSEAAFAGPAAVVRALGSSGSVVLRTDRDGTVRVRVGEAEDAGLIRERWREGRWERVPDG